MSIDIFITKEGTTTLLDSSIDETYHSRIGVMQECDSVYVRGGLDFFINKNIKEINVFEMGFGTGLNAWKTSIWAYENNIKVDYLSIEKNPLSISVIQELNYKEWMSNIPNYHLWFDKIHEIEWEKENKINTYFSLQKLCTDFCHADFIKYADTCHICFYDAFAPNKQPEIWERSILEKTYRILKKNGILTTYCSQGQFRRTLQSIGFDVHKIVGPKGKRHITRAIKV